MTWKRPIGGLAVIALIGACGTALQTEEPGATTVDTLFEVSTASTQTGWELASGSATERTDNVDGPDSPILATESLSESQSAATTTITTPVTSTTPVTTTTNTSTTTTTVAAIDMQAVLDALDALDAVLGDFDSTVGAIDLDEAEGETP